MPDYIEPFSKDDPKAGSASQLESMRQVVVADSRLSVEPPYEVIQTSGGRSVRWASEDWMWGKLSGSASPYSFTKQIPLPDGTFEAGFLTDSSNAYEVNGIGGLDGKTVLLRRGAPDDWRFQILEYGTAPCSARICVRVLLDIDGTTPVTDATVTITHMALVSGVWTTVTDGSGTTSDGGQFCLDLSGSGGFTVSVNNGCKTTTTSVAATCHFTTTLTFYSCKGSITPSASDTDTDVVLDPDEDGVVLAPSLNGGFGGVTPSNDHCDPADNHCGAGSGWSVDGGVFMYCYLEQRRDGCYPKNFKFLISATDYWTSCACAPFSCDESEVGVKLWSQEQYVYNACCTDGCAIEPNDAQTGNMIPRTIHAHFTGDDCVIGGGDWEGDLTFTGPTPGGTICDALTVPPQSIYQLVWEADAAPGYSMCYKKYAANCSFCDQNSYPCNCGAVPIAAVKPGRQVDHVSAKARVIQMWFSDTSRCPFVDHSFCRAYCEYVNTPASDCCSDPGNVTGPCPPSGYRGCADPTDILGQRCFVGNQPALLCFYPDDVSPDLPCPPPNRDCSLYNYGCPYSVGALFPCTSGAFAPPSNGCSSGSGNLCENIDYTFSLAHQVCGGDGVGGLDVSVNITE